MTDALLTVRELVVRYPSRGLWRREQPPAVDRVSFTLQPGQTLGIVGESGSGKTSLLRAILRLLTVASGSITFDGDDWLALDKVALRQARRQIGVVAQNPYLSLSPRLTLADIVAEPMRAADVPEAEIAERSARLLLLCGLPREFMTRRASELSGGQAQRVAIARALALQPKLLILDEPTSALDVSVQAQILNLLVTLQRQFGLSYLFVTHNLSVVHYMADEIMVMRQGKVVEQGATEQLVHRPAHAYTRELLEVLAQG